MWVGKEKGIQICIEWDVPLPPNDLERARVSNARLPNRPGPLMLKSGLQSRGGRFAASAAGPRVDGLRDREVVPEEGVDVSESEWECGVEDRIDGRR